MWQQPPATSRSQQIENRISRLEYLLFLPLGLSCSAAKSLMSFNSRSVLVDSAQTEILG